MRSAKVRFPRLSTRFTTWVTSTEWYTGSGINSRRTAGPLRGTSGLLLGAVAATGLIPLTHAGCVERSADHLVTDTRQVLHTAAADQHDRVLLEVVAFAGDVGGDLEPTGQPDTGHLPERRVRLLRGVGVDAGAHAPSLGRTPQGRGLRLGRLGGPAFESGSLALRLAGLLPRFPPAGLRRLAPVPLHARTSNLHGEFLSIHKISRLSLVYQINADKTKTAYLRLSAFICGHWFTLLTP